MDRTNLEAIRNAATAKKSVFKTINVKRFNPVIGCEVSGIDLSQQHQKSKSPKSAKR